MADVFVSYRHSDRDVVAPIAEGLERRQIDVWFDRVDIRSGERWRERIAEGIKDAQSVLVAVGPEGIAGVQAFEVDLALDRAVLEVDLPIIPLLLPGAKQEGRLWSYLATRSYVEMEGATDDDIVDRIADAVRGTSSTGLAAAVDTGPTSGSVRTPPTTPTCSSAARPTSTPSWSCAGRQGWSRWWGRAVRASRPS